MAINVGIIENSPGMIKNGFGISETESGIMAISVGIIENSPGIITIGIGTTVNRSG